MILVSLRLVDEQFDEEMAQIEQGAIDKAEAHRTVGAEKCAVALKHAQRTDWDKIINKQSETENLNYYTETWIHWRKIICKQMDC